MLHIFFLNIQRLFQDFPFESPMEVISFILEGLHSLISPLHPRQTNPSLSFKTEFKDQGLGNLYPK